MWKGFHPGEGSSRGLLCDFEPSCGPSFQALAWSRTCCWPQPSSASASTVSRARPGVTSNSSDHKYILATLHHHGTNSAISGTSNIVWSLQCIYGINVYSWSYLTHREKTHEHWLSSWWPEQAAAAGKLNSDYNLTMCRIVCVPALWSPQSTFNGFLIQGFQSRPGATSIMFNE